MELIDDIGTGPVALDTSVFIYLIEEDPRFLPVVRPLFEAIDQGSLRGVTSALTLMEVLIAPYRAGDRSLAERYEALLTSSRGLRLLELDRTLLRTAARLRAVSRLKAPDAIQVAAALIGGCATFVTNDRRLPAVPGVRALQVGNYLSSS